jgi:hypothetical protein
MRIVINLLLLVLIAGLIYLLVNGISEPIKFRAEKDKREKAVTDRLKDIRTSQEMYRSIYNEYAPDFQSLSSGLKNGKFAIIKVLQDPDDPTSENFTYDTTFAPSFDSIQTLGINLDSLAIVPYGEGNTFNMQADTITYQKTLTHVMEAGVKRKVFMGKYGNPSYAKYDDRYDPNSSMMFGSMDSPNLGGNWE